MEDILMMSEKRFERWNDNSCKAKDNQEGILLNWEDIINKLNKQQDTIGEQKIAIDELITDYKKLEKENEQLKEENEQLRKQVKSSETTSDATSNYNAHLESKITTLEKENEQLRKQIQNYEQLISNSYVGEEETLDGFLGKYVIWEDELQKYKNKNEMINNG